MLKLFSLIKRFLSGGPVGGPGGTPWSVRGAHGHQGAGLKSIFARLRAQDCKLV